MRFGSMCSGIEAASVAFSPLGWRAAWFAEIDPFASAVLAHHYPDVANLGDMTTISRRILLGEVEAPDALVGGTPCQAFSVAGLGESLDDERGILTLKFVETANAIDFVRGRRGEQPCSVLWENVPGVLSTHDNAFGCFLAGLAREDAALEPPGGKWSNSGAVYGPTRAVAWRTLDAQYFGLAQRRRRVFVVASARNGFDPAAVLFEWDGLRRDSAPSREAREGTARGVEIGPAGGCFTDLNPTLDTRAKDGPVRNQLAGAVLQAVASTLDASFGRLQGCSGQDSNHGHSHLICMAHGQGGAEVSVGARPTLTCNHEAPILAGVTHSLRGEGFDASEDGTGRGTPLVPVAFDTTQITSAANYSNPKPGEPCHPLAAGAHPPAIAFSSKDHGADATTDLAPTLRAMNHAGSHANGGGQMAVAFQERGREGSRSLEVGGDVAYALTAPNGGGRAQERNVLTPAMQVRRLTPRECERLQGFPDDYTLIPWRKKPASECPDGPRYKALGNSWAVPCVRWIGRRLDAELNRMEFVRRNARSGADPFSNVVAHGARIEP